MKKKVACLTVFIGMLMASVCYGSEDISITVDGEELETDTPAQIIEGRTMVPLRAIFEALGANVEWDGSSKSIKAQKGDVSIDMQIDNKIFKVSNEEKELDVPPLIIDGRTMVPARAVAESLDCEVEWDSVNKNVIITKSDEVTTEITTEITTEETTETTTEEVTEETTETVTEEKWIEYFMSRDDKPEPIDETMLSDPGIKEYHLKARKDCERVLLLIGARELFDVWDRDKVIEYSLYNDVGTSNKKTIKSMIENLWNSIVDRHTKEFTKTYSFKSGGGLHMQLNDIMDFSCTEYNDNVNVILFSLADEEGEGISSYIVVFVNEYDDVIYYNLESREDGTYSIDTMREIISEKVEEINISDNKEDIVTGLENDKRAFLEKVSELVKESGFLDI